MLKEKVNKIEFIAIQAQRLSLGEKVAQAMEKVIQHGHYILGPEVEKLENKLLSYTQATDVITCANGTDALRLLLLAHGIGPGDAVFVPSFTFASTAEVVAQANAVPIFVDICPTTFNIDPNSLEEAVKAAVKTQLKPKGIIAVDLFGLPADYTAINAIANEYQLWIIADAAQSFGGTFQDKKVGSLASMTTTSFFPSKPLACYGDGGAIFTTEPNGTLIRSLRNHGCGAHRYDHIHIGLNSRLDTLQAAILIEKLNIFPEELQRRQAIANQYTQALSDFVHVPKVAPGFTHAWGLYTITCEKNQRAHLMQTLSDHDIPCNIYYHKPLHRQPAYQDYPQLVSIDQAEALCDKVLSLPMHPYLSQAQIEYIIHYVKEGLFES